MQCTCSIPGCGMFEWLNPFSSIYYIISITSEDAFAGFFRSDEAQLRRGEHAETLGDATGRAAGFLSRSSSSFFDGPPTVPVTKTITSSSSLPADLSPVAWPSGPSGRPFLAQLSLAAMKILGTFCRPLSCCSDSVNSARSRMLASLRMSDIKSCASSDFSPFEPSASIPLLLLLSSSLSSSPFSSQSQPKRRRRLRQQIA